MARGNDENVAKVIYKVGKTRSRAFNPVEIVHARYTLKYFDAERRFRFGCSRAVKSLKDVSLDKFIRDLQDSRVLVTPVDWHNPLDIDVYNQCYVVVELDPEINWRFADPVVTTRADYGGKNFGLTPVPDKHGRERHIAYFSVCERKDYSGVHKDDNFFNFHVEFVDENRKEVVGLIIDPDVTNPGGTGIPPKQLIGKQAGFWKKLFHR